MDIVICVLITAASAVIGLSLGVGPRLFTRAFWRPDPSIRRDFGDIGRGLIALPMLTWKITVALFQIALGLGAIAAALYGMIWIVHAMWRAT